MGATFSKRGRRIVSVFLPITMINFLSFIVGVFILGGDAINGHIEDGRYFVANHERIYEVTWAQWTYSHNHACLVIANFILVPIAVVWLWFSGDMEI